MSKDDKFVYGFYTGERNGEHFDGIVSRNAVDNFRKDKGLEMWVDGAFIELMNEVTS